jgi:hypothetical protein
MSKEFKVVLLVIGVSAAVAFFLILKGPGEPSLDLSKHPPKIAPRQSAETTPAQPLPAAPAGPEAKNNAE